MKKTNSKEYSVNSRTQLNMKLLKCSTLGGRLVSNVKPASNAVRALNKLSKDYGTIDSELYEKVTNTAKIVTKAISMTTVIEETTDGIKLLNSIVDAINFIAGAVSADDSELMISDVDADYFLTGAYDNDPSAVEIVEDIDVDVDPPEDDEDVTSIGVVLDDKDSDDENVKSTTHRTGEEEQNKGILDKFLGK